MFIGTLLITLAFYAIPLLAQRLGFADFPYAPQWRLLWAWAIAVVVIFFVRFVAAQRGPSWRAVLGLILGLAISMALARGGAL